VQGPESALEPFHDRPFLGIRPRVVEALVESVTDEEVRRLAAGIRSIEHWVDNADVLTRPGRRLAAVRDKGSEWMKDAEPREPDPHRSASP